MALVGLNFLNREEASWRSMVKSTPFPFNTYLPPYYKKPQMVPYAAGFLWGALSSVYHMFFDDPVTMLNQAKEAAVDAYRTILYVIDLASTPEFWQHLGPIINNFFGHLVPPLPASMPQYDRGKRAGIFLVNIVMLILTVIDLMNLPEVIMGLFRNLKGLFTTLRNAGGMVQKFLGDGKAVESLQQMLRGFGKIDKEALKDLSRQKIRDVQRAVERIRNKTASGLPSASAISKAVPLRELVALLAKQLGVDLNSVQTPVKMFSEVKSELGELSQDRFMSGETKAAFRVSEKDGSRSIVVGDQFFEQAEAGQMTMNQYIRLAHEIRHAMVYDRLLTELGGDWRQAMLIDREISTNLYYKEVNEATTQYWAIEQIQSLHPSQTIPQNEWNYYAEHMNRARLRYRDARNLNLTPAQRAAASNSFGFKIFNVK